MTEVFTKDEARKEQDFINDQLDRLKSEAWDLYRKLGGEYSSCWDQYKDMERLGKIAKACRQLSDARASIGHAGLVYSNSLRD